MSPDAGSAANAATTAALRLISEAERWPLAVWLEPLADGRPRRRVWEEEAARLASIDRRDSTVAVRERRPIGVILRELRSYVESVDSLSAAPLLKSVVDRLEATVPVGYGPRAAS